MNEELTAQLDMFFAQQLWLHIQAKRCRSRKVRLELQARANQLAREYQRFCERHEIS